MLHTIKVAMKIETCHFFTTLYSLLRNGMKASHVLLWNVRTVRNPALRLCKECLPELLIHNSPPFLQLLPSQNRVPDCSLLQMNTCTLDEIQEKEDGRPHSNKENKKLFSLLSTNLKVTKRNRMQFVKVTQLII